MGRPQTIEEYLAGFTGQGRELLEHLCTLANEASPEASEAIKWGYPAWVHASVAFTPSTRAVFGGFATGKGTVKLPHGQPVPDDLLRRMIVFRVREHENDGVLWM